MNTNKYKALISLLDDEDLEVYNQIEREILSIGEEIIPFLEAEWESNFNPIVQKRIEEIIHVVQYETVLARLEEWKNKGGKDLLEGMWILATFQYPDLEISKLRKEIEQIYYDAWVDFQPEMNAYDQVRTLNNVLFTKLKFSANTKNFHSPANSMINMVLESKKGNPIALCVIYMLIAQKMELPIYGVNLPNLFILTYKTGELQFYINAFNKGLIFSKADIDNYISHLNLNPMDIFYQPCNNIEIMKRVLRNLIISFEKLGDTSKVEEVKRLLSILADGLEEEGYRD